MTTRINKSGFGLLEVVISAGILALVVGAAAGLVRSSLRRTVLAADRSVAMNLAQESIEELRSARDSTFIDGDQATGWDAHLMPNLTSSTSCDVVLPARDVNNCSLKITLPTNSAGWPDPVRGFETIPIDNQDFTREIYITVPPPGYVQSMGIVNVTEADVVRKIHVIVRWDNGNQAVESETYLTNWRSGV